MDYSKLTDSQLMALHSGDYSKLSDDELKSLHESFSPSPEPGILESTGRGLAQGATLGFGDEAMGALQAPLGALKQTGHLLGIEPKTGDKDVAAYIKARDESRHSNEEAQKAHPYLYGAGEIAGGFAPAALTGGSLPALGALGATTAAGMSNAQDPGELAKEAAIGGGAAVTGGAALKAAAPYASDVAGYIGKKLGGGADALTLKATGATGREASEFLPGTAKALRDQGIVKFGGTPAGVAENAGNAITESYAKAPLESATNTISKQEIIDGIDKQIADLSSDPSKAPAVRQLQTIKENVASPNIPEELSLEEANQIKKNFANPQNWENPASGIAPKAASSVYRNLVQQKAMESSPELGNALSNANQTFQMMNPVKEAGERAASTQAQSKIAGIGDIAAAAGGAAAGGPMGAVASVAGKHLLAPRLPSMGAVALGKGADWMTALSSSNLFQPNQLRKLAISPYALTLQNAARSGGMDAVSTTHYVLQQTDPRYQELLKNEQE